MKNVTEQTTVPEVDQSVLAEQIAAISDSLTKLLKSGLTQNAIVILIQADTGLGRGAISSVLLSLKDLKTKYTSLPL
jgi:hypothetical protein